MIPRFVSPCLLLCSRSECICHNRALQINTSSDCLPVNLSDGLSQSLECLQDFKSLVVSPDLFFLLCIILIFLSCHIPGLSLRTLSPCHISAPSVLFSPSLSLSSFALSLSPWLPATPGLDKLARPPHLPAHL